MLSEAVTLVLSALLIFLGALVSAFAGFAGLAGAGAALLHLYPASLAVPLVMICSIATQVACLAHLRPRLNWSSSGVLIAGGCAGVPLAVYLLQRAGAELAQAFFGSFLVAYALYMIVRPRQQIAVSLPPVSGLVSGSLVGFAGGVVGAMTAMPGAIPTVWCDLRGLTKDQQRGIVQPFMVVMQAAALVMILSSAGGGASLAWMLVWALPAAAAGTLVGLCLFGRVDEAPFRAVVLVLLLACGVGLLL